MNRSVENGTMARTGAICNPGKNVIKEGLHPSWGTPFKRTVFGCGQESCPIEQRLKSGSQPIERSIRRWLARENNHVRIIANPKRQTAVSFTEQAFKMIAKNGVAELAPDGESRAPIGPGNRGVINNQKVI